jgi:protoheme IX farnesyltransferase
MAVVSDHAVGALDGVRAYYMLAKPGIIYGNSISAAAGFFLASTAVGRVDWRLLLATLVGTALVIGGGCALNNIIDRDIDKKMQRTKRRALVTHQIGLGGALLFASILCATGFAILALWVNMLAVYVGLVGLYSYVLVYSVAKRWSPLGTPLGSIAGSMPIVAGYVAVSQQLDLTALLLFLTMALWQMPHFFAIAMYRLDDYKAASLPVLPAVKGNHQTKLQALLYIIAFTVSASALSLAGQTGWVYVLAMVVIGSLWFWKGMRSFKTLDDTVWAKRMFGFSLIVMLSFSFAISVGGLLP